MKFFALILTISASSFTTYAQEDLDDSEVPTAVKEAFQAEFADTSDVEWELDGNIYEVEFEVDDADYRARLDNTGKVISYKQEIEEEALPAEVMTALQNDYADFEVDDAEKLTQDGNTYYQVELEKFLREEEVVYSETGELQTDMSYWN